MYGILWRAFYVRLCLYACNFVYYAPGCCLSIHAFIHAIHTNNQSPLRVPNHTSHTVAFAGYNLQLLCRGTPFPYMLLWTSMWCPATSQVYVSSCDQGYQVIQSVASFITSRLTMLRSMGERSFPTILRTIQKCDPQLAIRLTRQHRDRLHRTASSGLLCPTNYVFSNGAPVIP